MGRRPARRNSGTSSSGANFAHAPNPSMRPRRYGNENSAIAHATKAAITASLELDDIAYVVNGNVAQQNTSVAARRPRPRRQPANARPAAARASKATAVPCAAGRSSQRPDQPSAAVAGT